MILVRLALMASIAYAAAVADTSLADAMEVRHAVPSFVALAAFAWQLIVPGRFAFVEAAAIALAGDLCLPGRPGAGAAAMLLVAYGLARLRPGHYAVQVPIVLAGTSLWVLATGFARWLLGDSAPGPMLLVRQSIVVGVYTAAVSLPVLMVIAWVRESLAARSPRMEGG